MEPLDLAEARQALDIIFVCCRQGALGTVPCEGPAATRDVGSGYPCTNHFDRRCLPLGGFIMVDGSPITRYGPKKRLTSIKNAMREMV